MSLRLVPAGGHTLSQDYGDALCRPHQCGAGCRRRTGRRLCRSSGSTSVSAGLRSRSRWESATLAGQAGEVQAEAGHGDTAATPGDVMDRQAWSIAAPEQSLSLSAESVHPRRSSLLGIAACLALPSALPALAEALVPQAPLSESGLTEEGRSNLEETPSLSEGAPVGGEAGQRPGESYDREAPQESASEAPTKRGLAPDTTITQRVFLDFSLCPTAIRLDRTLGDRSLICADGEPLGRVVLGLYGNQVGPQLSPSGGAPAFLISWGLLHRDVLSGKKAGLLGAAAPRALACGRQ